jgi:hypothetical protein
MPASKLEIKTLRIPITFHFQFGHWCFEEKVEESELKLCSTYIHKNKAGHCIIQKVCNL